MQSHLSWWLAPALIGIVLLVLFSFLRRRHVRALFDAHFQESRRERLFVSSLGFFVAIAVVRSLTWAIHNQIGPFHDISMRGRHIHHLVWGILTLLLVGYLWVLELGTGKNESPWYGRITCALFGAGAALTLDEFALWLNLRDVYWEREGRSSLEAIAIFGALLSIGLLGGRFFRAVALHVMRRLPRR